MPRRLCTLGLVLCLAALGQTSRNDNTASQTDKPHHSATRFTDGDAANIMDRFRQALESNNQRGLLKLFDPARLPDYPAFRDQVEQFFDRNDAFQVQYRITQVSNEENFGVVLAEFQLEATASGGSPPSLRRRVQLRLVLAWDGKQWKVVDLAPRALFE